MADTDSPLVVIQHAAALMRRRAEAANTDESRRPYGDPNIDPVPESGWGALIENYLGGALGRHCAAWNPAVATAVAAWLEWIVGHYMIVGYGADLPADLAAAVDVARSYLGDQAELATRRLNAPGGAA